MTSISCDIVLLPSPELAQKAVNLSQQLSKFGSQFVLKDGEYFPHLSLYMVRLKIDDIKAVEDFLNKIAATKSPECKLAARRYYQSHGYIDVEYRRTASLDDLQAKIIAKINPLRDGLLDVDKTRLQAATGSIKENLERYGYVALAELFRPHMTFTRLNTNKLIAKDEFPSINHFDGPFTKLGLFELDGNNSCIRKIAECKLAGA